MELTDALIADIISDPKTFCNLSPFKWRVQGKSKQYDGDLLNNKNLKMKIYFRQSLVYNDSFSCGIRIETDDGDSISIVRYNGGSHVHENKLEGNKFEYVPHIHVATERYYRISKRMVDAYAETTDRYTTLNDAIKCILADCNIKGFNMDVLQYTEDLFDGLESS